MYKTRVMESANGGNMEFCYVEMDPSERYGRFKDILGKGAMKTVYRAFDEFLGMEVAWNQVKLNDVLGSPEEMQRLYSEVHLLKNLNHESIMRSCASWIDVNRRTFNFITEMFTSGTLREYRKRYPRLNIRAIKDWARQILKGLDYLHSHDPPVIHRDLKCDNIFVNGHLGQVKIGDLGLAAILRGSHHAHSVIGTPEFMAPELYEEDYDELVDIYSFGMCVLEMLTSEYPYSECTNPAQIYKKVTSGKLPEAFFQIDDFEARRFVGRCLEKAPDRPTARELLMDPFLSIEEVEDLLVKEVEESLVTTFPYQKADHSERAQELMGQMEVPARSTDMEITGTLNSEDDTIFLKVRLSDKTGHTRNIYFPFDITSDTPLDVATEMVKELEITNWEPSEIADMINKEISAVAPSWKNPGSPKIHQQHSFSYIEDANYNDENSPHHPFYCTSSLSSSQASLPGVFSLNNAQFHQRNSLHDWLQEELKVQDDASSESSSFSYNLKYSANEDDLTSHSVNNDPRCISRNRKGTRFCPEGIVSKNCNPFNGAIHQQKMMRTGSLIDIRSQLLHRTLLEEINKQRLFSTVGAVENIGYHEPNNFSGDKAIVDIFPGKSGRGSWISHKRILNG